MSELQFDIGQPSKPRGHALIYMTNETTTMVAYLMMLPFKLEIANISKFLPKFLMEHLQNLGDDRHFSVVLTPPTKIDSVEQAVKLAEVRSDDLVFAGEYDESDQNANLEKLNRTFEQYRDLCDEYDEKCGLGEIGKSEKADELPWKSSLERELDEADELPVGEKLNKLTSLLGQIHDHLKHGDTGQVEEVHWQMRKLAEGVDARYGLDNLIKHGASLKPADQQLSRLYLTRAYQMDKEEYLLVEDTEKTISALLLKQTDAN